MLIREYQRETESLTLPVGFCPKLKLLACNFKNMKEMIMRLKFAKDCGFPYSSVSCLIMYLGILYPINEFICEVQDYQLVLVLWRRLDTVSKWWLLSGWATLPLLSS